MKQKPSQYLTERRAAVASIVEHALIQHLAALTRAYAET